MEALALMTRTASSRLMVTEGNRLAGIISLKKPMMGDPSGLTDTMWDMVVNAMGAFIISFMGWWYLKRKGTFFVRDWIRKFIGRNPRMFNNG